MAKKSKKKAITRNRKASKTKKSTLINVAKTELEHLKILLRLTERYISGDNFFKGQADRLKDRINKL